MKQHSYNSYNITLQHNLARFKVLKSREDDLDAEESVEVEDLRTELNLGEKMFPQTQTIYNFVDYLVVPSLVYELGFFNLVNKRIPENIKIQIVVLCRSSRIHFYR